MFDLVIRSDRVVTPAGVGACDVAVQGERIAAVAAAGTVGAGETRRLIDATGKIVMPGGIDPHVHLKWYTPSPDGTVTATDPPSVVSRAALYGGTTTMIDFVRWTHGNTIQQAIERRHEDWTHQCYCDYSLHVMIEGDLPPEIFGQLREALRSGYPTIKIFTTDITPSRRGRKVDFGDIWEVFKVVAEARGMCVIHGEDNDIVMHMYDKLIREGRTGFENMAEVHNALSEDLSFRRVLGLARNVPGIVLYFMHISAGNGVEAVREARARGMPVYGETLHQYLMYTAEDYKRPNGQMYHTYPSLKSQADQDALWAGMGDGTLHTVATDEVCCSLKVKTQGKRIDDTTGGNVGVEPRVALMYTEMVGRRGYSLEKFVDRVSTNAAKIMGLYPRKGALAAGSDADITVLDPALKTTIRKEMLHEQDYTPWEGHEVHVWPALTVLRGKVVVENGKFSGDLKDGQFLPRKISEEIRSGAML
ncbi:MAG TPA: amidohydrolase family protein [Burkholderiales bacterium]|jgi:dihydropyrimidinase|nr:amidohydrolase family protein [Burkholderiales bacterium]